MMEQEVSLSPSSHQRIYDLRIRPKFLDVAQSEVAPVAVILGGQPGSGKGRLANTSMRFFEAQGGAVLIDADELRKLHPHYHNLSPSLDKSAAGLTHPDAAAWANRLFDDAIASSKNIVLDQTSRDSERLLSQCDQLKKNGYLIELQIMAVNPLVSERQILSRYENAKEMGGLGRFMSSEIHHSAYRGLPDSVAAAEDGRAVDVVKVFDRSGQCLYVNTLHEGTWMQPPRASQVLSDERNKPMAEQDLLEHRAHYTKLKEQIYRPERQATAEEKSHVDKLFELAQKLVKPLQMAILVAALKINGLSPSLRDDVYRDNLYAMRQMLTAQHTAAPLVAKPAMATPATPKAPSL